MVEAPVSISLATVEPGARAEELLASVAATLQLKPSRKVEGVAVFWFGGMSAQAAWEATVDALNAAGDDWPDHLHPEQDDRPYSSSTDRLCSFCGKPERLVEKLVAGPGLYICDECVALCVEIIEAERASRAPGTGS